MYQLTTNRIGRLLRFLLVQGRTIHTRTGRRRATAITNDNILLVRVRHLQRLAIQRTVSGDIQRYNLSNIQDAQHR